MKSECETCPYHFYYLSNGAHYCHAERAIITYGNNLRTPAWCPENNHTGPKTHSRLLDAECEGGRCR